MLHIGKKEKETAISGCVCCARFNFVGSIKRCGSMIVLDCLLLGVACGANPNSDYGVESSKNEDRNQEKKEVSQPRKGNRIEEFIVLISAGSSRGTGFLCEMDGRRYMVTNEHVIRGGRPFKAVMIDGRRLRFKSLELAEDRDIVRCELEENLPVVKMLNGDPKFGDSITVYGNSGGEMVVTETKGKVIGIGATKVEVDAAFISGNSGSPIIDGNRQVIGVATYAQQSNDPSDWVKSGTRFSGVRRFGLRLNRISWKVCYSNTYFARAAFLRDTEYLLNRLCSDEFFNLDILHNASFADWPKIQDKILDVIDADEVLSENLLIAGNHVQWRWKEYLQSNYDDSLYARKQLLNEIIKTLDLKIWPNESMLDSVKEYRAMAKAVRSDYVFMRKILKYE